MISDCRHEAVRLKQKYLVGLVGGSSSNLALVAGSELGEVAVVVTLPVREVSSLCEGKYNRLEGSHLVVEDLGLASLSLGDQGLVQNVQHILADLLQLGLDLLTVVADDADVLLGALGLLLLLDGGDDTPRGTAGTDDVLVRDGQQVALVDGELAANLEKLSITRLFFTREERVVLCVIRWRLPVRLLALLSTWINIKEFKLTFMKVTISSEQKASSQQTDPVAESSRSVWVLPS